MGLRLRGGYKLRLKGRPSKTVVVPPEPEALYLPLTSRRFTFSQLCVKDGDAVLPGNLLAQDPKNYSVPLLAPRAGTVSLSETPGHITLKNPKEAPEEPYEPGEDAPHIVRNGGSVGIKRYKLLMLGAWQFFSEAYTDRLPDPLGAPSAVIISTMNLEPYTVRGDVQLAKRVTAFTRGIEHIQSLLEYQPIHLVVPQIESALGGKVRETVRGFAHVKVSAIPLVYPYHHPTVLARALGLKHDPQHPVWTTDVGGVLAVDRALTLGKPATVRLISVGGPAVNSPGHVKAMAGYPLRAIIEQNVSESSVRVISGGVMTGRTVEDAQKGVDAECRGLTVVPEHSEREFLAFMRPGFAKRSYSRCFLSSLLPPAPQRLTTGLKGERRPCISCVFCEEVCPVGIMPHQIHKLLYQNNLEEAERAGLFRCMACGLCSFVCPSKIELRGQLAGAQETIRRELETTRR